MEGLTTFSAEIALGVGLHISVHAGELLDSVAGLVGLDPMGDDVYSRSFLLGALILMDEM